MTCLKRAVATTLLFMLPGGSIWAPAYVLYLWRKR
jgi:hypothetical protein